MTATLHVSNDHTETIVTCDLQNIMDKTSRFEKVRMDHKDKMSYYRLHFIAAHVDVDVETGSEEDWMLNLASMTPL